MPSVSHDAPDAQAYGDLTSRERENHNFNRIAARLKQGGFTCHWRLADDGRWADFMASRIDGETFHALSAASPYTDFIACHDDGKSFLKVQLKGGLAVNRRYLGKGIRIAFILHERGRGERDRREHVYGEQGWGKHGWGERGGGKHGGEETETIYLYDHDRLVDHVEARGLIGAGNLGWHRKGLCRWNRPPGWARHYLKEHNLLEALTVRR